jgi:hypothetical protein
LMFRQNSTGCKYFQPSLIFVLESSLYLSGIRALLGSQAHHHISDKVETS